MAGGNSTGSWTWGTLPTPQDPSHQGLELATDPLALPQTHGGEKEKKTLHPKGKLGKTPKASGKESEGVGGWTGLTHASPLKIISSYFPETLSLERPTAPSPSAHEYLCLLFQEGICTLRRGQHLGAGAPSKHCPQL